MIDRNVEEALNLVLMEVDADHAVCAGCHEHVGHQFGADGDPGLVLAVLPPVAEVGHHSRHASRRSPPRGIDQQQQFHGVFGRGDRGLQDVDIPATCIPVDPHEDLTVSKVADGRTIYGLAEDCAYLSGQGLIRAPGKHEDWPLIEISLHGFPSVTAPVSGQGVPPGRETAKR